MDIDAKMKEIVLEILDVKEEQVVPQASLIEELGATSIDLVEILTAMQNTFDIEIDESQASQIKTVQDAADLVKASVGADTR